MLSNGDEFAGYVIERTLGRGGMGSVYLAKHPRLPRMTALKLLNREMVFDKEIRARFEREADLVSGLDHHNIVTVYDRGLEDGQLWISMQYIDGVDAASVNPQALPPERAVQIIAETADALDYAHRNEVLHRDVKPANIMLARSTGGKGERVYLTDFGIARLRDETSNLTQTGTFTATLAYASPEQLTGSVLDGRSDQYSLACTLFWLLTGSGPFQATNPAAVIQGHLQNPPPPVTQLRQGLPQALDMVIAKAMAKRPEDRFVSCSEFAAAARRALASPSAPAMPLVNPRTAPPMPFAATGGPAPTAGPMTSGPNATAGPMHTSGPRTAPPNPTAAPAPYPTMVNTVTPPPQQVAPFTPNRPTNQYTTPGYNYSNPGTPTVPPPGMPPGTGPRPMQQPPRKSNTGLIIGSIVGLLVLALVVVVVVVAASGGDDKGGGTAGGTTTTTSSAAVPVTNKTVDWSTVSQEFPRMLPASKSSETGYNGATCWLADSSSPPDADEGEPDFGNWTVQWRCFGGGNNEDPFYRVYGYDSSADLQSVLSGLTPNEKSTDSNGGESYTNYQFTDLSRPRMVTNFTGDSDRTQMLMYTDGVVGSMDAVLSWWRSAPLN
ncbi:serine/threonine protein kinase [Nocardia sp. 2]|uniref:non-specific serine/threonine protein kinase n=1 Tax=Nocardia acididurans TaxID=2802282 RepID=A0ABS1M6G2_9NOCA|nr:serine/threonine-protein kinase [Nocardia acididurans]MBL1076205.1 serine/threonine protein kinase [Nocardia acididurans]